MKPHLFRESWLQSLNFLQHGIPNVSFGKTQCILIFHVRIPQNAEENLTVNMVMSKETKFILAKELPTQIWVILACNVIHCH